MASTINRQVAQALLKRLKSKDTTHGQAVRLAELIRVFQKLGPVELPTPDTDNVQPDSPDPPSNVLDL